MATVMGIVVGLLIIGAFSILAARAEQSLWRKCSRSEYRRQTQQQITLGKSRIR